jgi:aspartate-semialdehyde dehydrogenase
VRKFSVAVVGATGAVGIEMIRILEQRCFPVSDLRLFASARSKGRRLPFRNRRLVVEELSPEKLEGMEIGLFSAGSAVSKAVAPVAARNGMVVIDNTSAFRMDPGTPLVVPEVNPHAIARHRGIIANPNCATIQMVVALKPLRDAFGIKRIIVTTFQSVSGAGLRAMNELERQSAAVLAHKRYPPDIFPHQIAFNAIPQIPQSDAFLPDGFTGEETKIIDETRKILEDGSLRICATCVRIPVFRAHSESVTVETREMPDVAKARRLLAKAPGVVLMDDPSSQKYPMPATVAGYARRNASTGD